MYTARARGLKHVKRILWPQQKLTAIFVYCTPSVVAKLMQCSLDVIKKQVSVIYSRPGAPNQDWHCDGGHEQDDAGWPDQGRQLPKAYAVCVFLPLIDFNETVGYTDFWPGSHQHKGLLGFGPAAPMLGASYPAICKAGDAVVYDYRLMHRGMQNVSVSTERPMLQFLYTTWYHEATNYDGPSLKQAA